MWTEDINFGSALITDITNDAKITSQKPLIDINKFWSECMIDYTLIPDTVTDKCISLNSINP